MRRHSTSPTSLGFLLILVGLCLGLARPAAADQMVEAKGMANIGPGGVPKARDDATGDAMRKAVESAVGALVASQTVVENYQLLSDKIYTQSAGFVRSHKVLDEGREGNAYWVKIEAEVGTGKLETELETLGLLMARKGLPRVAVLIGEQTIGFHGWDVYWTDVATGESTMVEKLQAKGFLVVEPGSVKRAIERPVAEAAYGGDASAAKRLAGAVGPRFGADLLIVGQAVARDAGPIMGSALHSVQANVTARAVRPDTGEILAVAQAHAAKPHPDPGSGGAEAIAEATETVAEKLAQEVATKWAKEVSGTTLVKLEVRGLSFERLERFQSFLRDNFRAVKSVRSRGFGEGAGQLEVSLAGNLADLLSELRGKAFDGAKITVVEHTQNSAVVKL